MKKIPPDAVLRPSPKGWELWRFPQKGAPLQDADASVKNASSAKHLVLALPTRSLLAVPLWISPHGVPLEIAEMELSSRHILRKGAAVEAIPILQENGRSLVLAVASVDDDSALEYFSKAHGFELPARLIDPAGADVVIWREWEFLCFAFYRDATCVFFGATGDKVPDAGFCSQMARASLRLQSENVLTKAPQRLRVIGDFSYEDKVLLGEVMKAEWDHVEKLSVPVLPEPAGNPAPPAAREFMQKRGNLKRLASFAMIAVVVYTLILLVVAADLLVHRIQIHRLDSELQSLEASASSSESLVNDWKKFRPAMDPTVFAIDQLAAVAAEIPGEKVRLTQYTSDNGRLTIAGEAADVSQAYEFAERVKKAPLMQDYDWTSRQPQLVGRNKVRFEMEGTHPDAKTAEE
jgi:hypothetical protein